MSAETTTSNGFLCETRNVSHEFITPSGTKLRVLENISLGIKKDEVVALLGPSGCGKSTILRILAGLIKPTAGAVFYRDQPVVDLNPGVAFVFQSFALYPWMTVGENIAAVLRARQIPTDEMHRRTKAVIKLVGLAGFEEAYPRELSGGMKQRAGMARALSIEPEILFMDEPFSHVDSLTAEGLRAEVLELWSKGKSPSSILLVSHDIQEVAMMADRIVFLSANPGRVRSSVENPLRYPRDSRSADFLSFVEFLHEKITGHELPDLPAETPAAPMVEPLPYARTSQILGLIEYLDNRGGTADIFASAVEAGYKFGPFLEVVRAAEMLDLADTPRRTVVLTPLGIKFAKLPTDEAKSIWSKQCRSLALFQKVFELLGSSPGRQVSKNEVIQLISRLLPNENAEQTYEVLVTWGRHGGLFSYDAPSETLSLPSDNASAV